MPAHLKDFVALILASGFAHGAEFPTMYGLNVPWDNFGYDIGGGSLNRTWFTTYFEKAQTNGQNVARFWVHPDGARVGLLYNADGSISGLSDAFTTDLRNVLTIARDHSVVVQLCLWSFDMCKDEMKTGSTKAHLITNEAHSQSYVEKALAPMLAAVSDFPNLIVETINEPEWCMQGSQGSGTTNIASVSQMQRFVAMIAEGAHVAGRKVTTGSASLKWNSGAHEAQGFYWNDAALQKAYPTGKNVGMDFYNVHYYDWMYNDQYGYDPMRKNTTYWGLDKPTVVGEIPPTSTHYSTDDMLNKMEQDGFKGAMFWAYNDPSFTITDSLLSKMKSHAQRNGATYQAILDWLSFTPSPAPPSPPPGPPAPPPPPPGPQCADTAPDTTYTCAQQKSWGKCNETWMAGYCCKSCFDCDSSCTSGPSPAPPSCADKAPDDQYTCEEQKGWGKCSEKFMVGFCCKTCFNCDSKCGASGDGTFIV